MKHRLKILQIFNRYLAYGGEEGSVGRIGDAMHDLFDVEYFISSSNDFFGSRLQKLKAPFLAFHNGEICRKLNRYQRVGQFDFWQIHNVFPVMSPSVYSLARELGVPIVQYLHNYRMSCVNGFFLNHGKPCTRCIDGNFLPALTTACWHNNHLQSGWMGLVLTRLRKMGVFQQVAAWLALSERQKALHVRMGIPAERIFVVPHFYEPEVEPHPIPPNGHVLFLGRLSREKGVDVLLKAWSLLPPLNRELLIAGEGPERPLLERQAHHLGLKNVRFLGFVPKAKQAELWRETAFHVVPSVWEEPFGMVALETWAHGRPLIVSQTGGLDEIVTHGFDGLKTEPSQPELLASVIAQMAGLSSQKLAILADNGRQKLLQNYSKKQWLENYRQVYDRIAPPL